MMQNTWRTATVLSVATLCLAACGGGGKETARDSSSKPALKIVELVAIPGDPSTGKAGVDAAIKAINDAGGVDGRPIEIKYCEGPNINKTQQCARDAVADKSVLASVNNLDIFGGFTTIGDKGGLPGVGNLVAGEADYSCKTCFFVGPGTLVSAGLPGLLHDVVGATHIAGAFYDVPSAQGRNRIIGDGVMAPRGEKLIANIPVPPSATDVAPIVAALPKETDGLYISSTQDQSARLILQARKSGASYPIAVSMLSFSDSGLKKLVGNQGTDVYGASMFDAKSAGYQQYEKELARIGKDGSAEDNACALNGWLAVHLFADMVKKAGVDNVTRESLIAALAATSDYDTQGLTPPLDWTKSQKALGGSMAAIRSPYMVAYKYNTGSGKLERVGDKTFIPIFGAGS